MFLLRRAGIPGSRRGQGLGHQPPKRRQPRGLRPLRGLRLPLLADTDRAVARAFGITAPLIGLRRAVFIIAPDGTLHWKHVTAVGATFPQADTITEQLARLGTS